MQIGTGCISRFIHLKACNRLYYHRVVSEFMSSYCSSCPQEERMQEIKNAAVPYNTVGLLELR
jgi:hypothetical protein